ncbi:hypothetical protein, partial [Bacillus toyonensis]|uniref:hypothetical protein n=1 Tax=Bacillus toyonensis TaxID=155322 RepID=UPI003D658179
SIKIITDTYDLERCFLSSHSQGSLQIYYYNLLKEFKTFYAKIPYEILLKMLVLYNEPHIHQAKELVTQKLEKECVVKQI